MDDSELTLELWRSWADRGAALTDEQWSTPTRLAGWTVKELFAHAAPVPDELLAFLSASSDDPPAATTGAEMLRAFNRPGGVAHVAAPSVQDAARRTAATVTTDELVSRFRAITAADYVARITAIPAQAVVPHPLLGAVTVGALVEVSVMEHTVHLLDLIAAVGGPPAPAEAVTRTLEIVLAIPEPVQLLESVTGRAGLELFPLLR